jgi:putative hydrolase
MAMSDRGNEGNPLQGLLADLLKVVGGASGGATPWLEAARALAHGVATDGEPEANIDPIRRIELEDLARVVEMHVTEATGLPLARGGRRPPTFEPVTRGTWALRALDAWRPLVEPVVTAAAGGGSLGLGQLGAMLGDEGGAGMQGLLDQFAVTMGPVLFGMQLGSAAGHLAKRTMGQYALPVPWPDSNELLIVSDNVTAFAEDWSLPLAETRLWVCLRELTMHAVMCQPEVERRLRSLIDGAMRAAVDAQQGLTERLGAHASDPEALQGLLSDPESLLADLLGPGHRAGSAQLTALTTAIGGYVDHVTGKMAQNLVGSNISLSEAWARFRGEDDDGQQAAGALFGLDLGREEVERGAAFVRGVVERAGEDGLNRLWASARNLPTPAEVDAPGLWLERISLPELPDPEDEGGAADLT